MVFISHFNYPTNLFIENLFFEFAKDSNFNMNFVWERTAWAKKKKRFDFILTEIFEEIWFWLACSWNVPGKSWYN